VVIANLLLSSSPFLPLFSCIPILTTAHARHTCLVNRWAATEDKSKCANCYCYVCDGKASLCPAWEIHCHAFPSQEWKQARAKWKREAAQRKAYGAASSAAAAGHAALVGAAVGGTCKCTHVCSPALMFMKYTFSHNPVKTTYPSGQRTDTYAAKFKCVDCTKMPPQPLRTNLGKQMFGPQFLEGVPVSVYRNYLLTSKLDTEETIILQQRQAVENSLWKHMKQRGGDADRNSVDAVVSRIRFIVGVQLFVQVLLLLSKFFPFIFFSLVFRLKKLYLHHTRIDYGNLTEHVVVK
jgi:hypothetical protein